MRQVPDLPCQPRITSYNVCYTKLLRIAARVIAFLHTHLGRQQPLAWPKEVIVALYTVAIFAVSDLSRYWLHRWMHTVPFLWRFHRVHLV